MGLFERSLHHADAASFADFSRDCGVQRKFVRTARVLAPVGGLQPLHLPDLPDLPRRGRWKTDAASSFANFLPEARSRATKSAASTRWHDMPDARSRAAKSAPMAKQSHRRSSAFEESQDEMRKEEAEAGNDVGKEEKGEKVEETETADELGKEAGKDLDEEEKEEEKEEYQGDEDAEDDMNSDIVEVDDCRMPPSDPYKGSMPPPGNQVLEDRGPQKQWVDDGECSNVSFPTKKEWLAGEGKRYTNVNPPEMFMTEAQKKEARHNAAVEAAKEAGKEPPKEEKDDEKRFFLLETPAGIRVRREEDEAAAEGKDGKVVMENPSKQYVEAEKEEFKKDVGEEVPEYAEFDSNGIPTKRINGHKMDKHDRRPLRKEWKKTKAHWADLEENEKHPPGNPFHTFMEGEELKKWSEWDERGVPTKDEEGKDLSEEQLAELDKKYHEVRKGYFAWQTQRQLDTDETYKEYKRSSCESFIGKFEGEDPGGTPANRASPCRYQTDNDTCEVNDKFKCNLEPCQLTGVSDTADTPIQEVSGGECGNAPGPRDLGNAHGREFDCGAYYEFYDKTHFPDMVIRCEDEKVEQCEEDTNCHMVETGKCRRSGNVCNPTIPANDDKSSMSEPLAHDGKNRFPSEAGAEGEDEQYDDDSTMGLAQGLGVELPL